MPTLVRNTGQTGVGPNNISRPVGGGRAALSASDGSAVLVVADSNETIADTTFGDHTGVSKIYVYTSANRIAWTLRATITTAAPLAKPNLWNAELFTDNSIGIVYRGDDGSVRYHKVTTGTWAVSASETVLPATAGVTPADCDIHISDSNIPVVAILRNSTSGTRLQASLYVRRTSDSTWFNGANQTLLVTENPDPENACISVSVLQGGSSTARNVVFATSHGIAAAADAGCLVFSTVLNESTGTITTPVQRASIGASDIPIKHGLAGPVRRVQLFTDASNIVNLGVMVPRSGDNTLKTYFARYSWNGTTWTSVVPVNSNSGDYYTTPGYGMAMSYGNGSMVYFYSVDSDPIDNYLDIISYVSKIGTNNAVYWSGFHHWSLYLVSGAHQAHAFGNGQKFSSQATFDMTLYSTPSLSRYTIYHSYLVPAAAPFSVTPDTGATVTTSLPTLTDSVTIPLKVAQSTYKAVWQIASDSAFTTNLVEYEQPDTDFINAVESAASPNSSVVSITDVLPPELSLAQGTWFIRACLEDTTGTRGAFSAPHSFIIAHKPAAVNLSPSLDVWRTFGAGNVSFDWDFSDPSSDDYQTAFQVLVTRASDGATVLDSGKIVSATSNYSGAIPSANKNAQLRWQVRLWDRDNVAGDYSQFATFYTGDAATANITLPANGSTVTTTTPGIQITGTAVAGRPISLYRYTVLSGTTVVYDSGLKQAGNLAGAYTISGALPTGFLLNNHTYTMAAYVIDSAGLQSLQSSITFTTGWTLPPTPTGLTVSTTNYGVDGAGYVSVVWSDAARDPQFQAWAIYRRSDLIDPNTNAVVTTGAWELLGTNSTIGATHEYRDFYAPAGYGVVYRITQIVSRFGDIVESANVDSVMVFPKMEGYFLIDLNAQAGFSLNFVVGDSYTDEWEEEEFIISGRGRHVDKGEHLGLKGQLEVQLRNSIGQTARQKKMRLELMKETNNVLFLRTPFGDIYRVSAGNMAIARIAGVGTQEFCDVTLPYTEVGA